MVLQFWNKTHQKTYFVMILLEPSQCDLIKQNIHALFQNRRPTTLALLSHHDTTRRSYFCCGEYIKNKTHTQKNIFSGSLFMAEHSVARP